MEKRKGSALSIVTGAGGNEALLDILGPSPPHTHSHSLTHTLTLTHSLTHIHSHTLSHTYTLSYTLAHTLTLTHTHSHPARALRHLTPFLSPIKNEPVYITVSRFTCAYVGPPPAIPLEKQKGLSTAQPSPQECSAFACLHVLTCLFHKYLFYFKDPCPVAFI